MSELPAHNPEGMKPREAMGFPEISQQVLADIGEIIRSGRASTIRTLLLVALAAAGVGCEKKAYEAPDREGRVFGGGLTVARDAGSHDTSSTLSSQSNGTKIVEIPTPEHLVYRGPEQSPAVAKPPAAQPNPVEYVSIKPEKWRVVPGVGPNGEPHHYKYIDENGENVFGDKLFEKAHPYSEGLALVKEWKAKRWHYINRNGVNAFNETVFREAESFSKGVALISDADSGSYFFINRRGLNAFGNKIFAEAKSFSEDLAAVNEGGENGKWYFINRRGVNAFGSKQFEGAKAFSEGLAEVENNGKWYYIDKKGKKAFGNKKFDRTSPFEGGFANVVEGIRPYTIDKTGQQVKRAGNHPQE